MDILEQSVRKNNYEILRKKGEGESKKSYVSMVRGTARIVRMYLINGP